MTNRYVAAIAGAALLLLAGLGWRSYMLRLGAVSFYAMPASLSLKLFITAELSAIATILLVRFVVRRTLLRCLSLLVVVALLLGSLSVTASALLYRCFASGVDCVPDGFDATAGKVLWWAIRIRHGWLLSGLVIGLALVATWRLWPKGNAAG